jgi:hypothetical protein
LFRLWLRTSLNIFLAFTIDFSQDHQQAHLTYEPWENSMKSIRMCLYFLALALVTSASAQAQATRTWVSGVGDDANPCSRTAPCKTFAGAISKTAAGGEIDALDPGGFGALTITKAITIDGGGGQVASVLVAGTNGIVVSAGASDVVTLRNLSINGGAAQGSPGINGINFTSGGALHIEHCTIFGFGQNGINIQPSTAANVSILDTISRDNAGSGIFGEGSGSAVHVTIDNSRFEGNVIGVFAKDSTTFAIRNSDASENSWVGYCASSDASSVALDISASFAANNTYGIQSGGGGGPAVVTIGGVSMIGNTGGGMLVETNGSIVSFGNNQNSGSGLPTSSIKLQ